MVLKKAQKKEDINFFPNRFIIAGFVLLFIALLIPISTFTPVLTAEINYQIQKDNPQTNLSPVNQDFSIIIPKIKANALVVPNVDPFDSKIYQSALTKGVAHAKGTATPDRSGNTFIFAHSAGNWYQANQFNAVFYLLNKLTTGDEIIIYYQSKKYLYSVSEVKLVDSNQINYLSSTPDKNQLTLMTCWPPGTTIKRLVVIASLVE